MALPKRIGSGGTGLYGDSAVKLRASLNSMAGLVNEVRTDHNALMAKFDADSGITATDYVATCGVTSGQANEVQKVTLGGNPEGGTFTLTYSGQTTTALPYNATSQEVENALVALSNLVDSEVRVAGDSGGPWTVEFRGPLAGRDVALMTINDAALTGGNTPSITITTTVPGTASPSVNEVQTVAVNNATGGTFTLTYAGQTTSAIANNANAATVTSALEALNNIGAGDVGVVKTGTTYTITFQTALAATNVAELTANASGLIGSSAVITATLSGVVNVLKNWFGKGGSGINGDAGRRLASSVNAMIDAANLLKTGHNAALAKLDADNLTGSDYVSLRSVAAPAVAKVDKKLGHGGLGLSGNKAVKLEKSLRALILLLNELKTDHNALLTKLDGDTVVGDTNYAATLSISAANAA